jgi:hypothetical protein
MSLSAGVRITLLAAVLFGASTPTATKVWNTTISIVATSTIHTTICRPIHQDSRILIGTGISQ